MDRSDFFIDQIRSAISDVATEFYTTTDDLVKFLNLNDEREYNSVIDSLYLLEDTQIAKTYFSELDLKQEPFGHLYLLFYGVLNACYMQQQALLVISSRLKISDNIKEILSAEIVKYRNDFSAHSSNRGRGATEHSYILDRHELREGKLSGYTLNHSSGTVYRNALIHKLLQDWNSLLEDQLGLITAKILNIKT